MDIRSQKIVDTKFCEQDIKMSRAIVAYSCVSVFNLTIKNIFPVSDLMWNLISKFLFLIMFFFMLTALPNAIKRSRAFFFLLESMMLVIYFISYLRGMAFNNVLLNGAFWTLGVCIPLATLVYSIQDYACLLYGLKNISYLLCILLWAVLYSMKNTETYNMAASYALVIPTLVILNEWFEKHKMINMICPIISIFLTILWGARGPLLCIGSYIILYFFFFLKTTRYKILLFIIGMLLFAMIILFKAEIVECISKIYYEHGMIGGHTIGRILQGTFLEGSGRNILVKHYMDLLHQCPIIGLGLYGGWSTSGDGPHNMLVEYLTAFGYPLGIIVCGIAIILYILPLFVKKGIDKQLLFIFLAFNIPMLWVRGVWTEKPEWFMFVAMVLAVWRRRDMQK